MMSTRDGKPAKKPTSADRLSRQAPYVAPHARADLVASLAHAFLNAGFPQAGADAAAFDILVKCGGVIDSLWTDGDPNSRSRSRHHLIERVHSKSADFGSTKREIANLKRSAENLCKAINALHEPALAAIGCNRLFQKMSPSMTWDPSDAWDGLPVAPGTPTSQLNLNVVLSQLHILLEEICQAQPHERTVATSKGRPPEQFELKIGVHVAVWYQRLAGKKAADTLVINNSLDEGPRVSGRFVDLLADVFRAVNVRKVSVANTAIRACDFLATRLEAERELLEPLPPGGLTEG